MFISALFTTVKKWKQPKCPSTNEWTEKMLRYSHGILFSRQRNEILPFVAKWMELEDTMSSEISCEQIT
jgi:hypothetical protein